MKFDHRRRGPALVAALVLMLVLAVAAPALSQEDPYGNGGPTVKPTLITDDSEPRVLPERVERSDPGVLPFTGGDVTLFLVIAFGAISAGVLLMKGRRTPGSET